MNNLSKITSIGLPTILGLGFAWVGIRVLRNESQLKNRLMELELQLDSASLNQTLNK
tara:strand:- start:162 stop:332 length:171 start_codon:yes stop_codon:yes gene_type:complete